MAIKSQPSLLYLTPDRIRLLVPNEESFDTYQMEREEEGLGAVFSKIQDQLELKSIQVILSPKLHRIVNLTDLERTDPDHILLETANQVDFDISSDSIGFNVQDEFVHVVAMPLDLLDDLSTAAFENKILIAGIFSISDVLATLSADQQAPYLLAWSGLEESRGIIQLVYQKLSFQPKTFARLTSKKITDLMKLCIDNFNTRPKLLYHNLPDGLPDLPKTIKEQEVTLNPLENLVINPLDINHPLVPSINPLDIEEEQASPVTKGPVNTAVLAVIIGAVIIGGLFVGGLLVSNKTIPFISSPTPTPTPTATPTPTPTPTPLDLSQFDLQVLNGTGTPGQASDVQELLQKAGFQEVDTGNADRYDYELTQVQLSPQAPSQLYQAIVDSLGEDFTATLSSQLDEDSQFDAIVITGQ